MRRRYVLQGLSASAVVLPALALARSPMVSDLDNGLFIPQTGAEPVTLDRMRQLVAMVRAHFAACEFRQLAAAMPRLIAIAHASRDAAVYDTRARFDALLSTVYVTGNELAIKLHENPVAWVMADRAVAAAVASGDPMTIAKARWRAAISLRRSKHPHTASSLITTAAQDLHRSTSLESGQAAGFFARMLCCAAYTAALAERRADAYDLLAHAREVVIEHRASSFGFADIDLYGISVARSVGDFGQAVQYSQQVPVGALATVERRTRFYEDSAIAWWGKGRPDKTYQAMLAAEAIAPQEVRYRPWAHRLTTNLLGCGQRTGLPGLREFAGRIGVGSGGE